MDAQAGGIGGQLEDVGTGKTVAAGQHHDRLRSPEGRNLADEFTALGRAQLARQRMGDGRRTAVLAGQPARSGRLPENQQRPLREIEAHPTGRLWNVLASVPAARSAWARQAAMPTPR